MPARIAGVKLPKALVALGRPTASGLGQQHGKKNMRPVNLQAVRSKSPEGAEEHSRGYNPR